MTRRTYVKVLDDLADHPAWLEISPAGVGLWVLSLGYCGRNLTDGMFPAILVRRFGGDDQVQAELVNAGRWHVHGHECAECPPVPVGRVYVHAYLDHQRSAEQVHELSAKRAEAGRKGTPARVANQVASQVATQSGTQIAEVGARKSTPKAEAESKKTLAAAGAAEFEQWWNRYPRKTGKAAAEKAYAKARKSASVTELAQGLLSAMSEWTAARTEVQFIPHPATWLNQGRWSDEPATLPGTVAGAAPAPRALTLAEVRQAELDREAREAVAG